MSQFLKSTCIFMLCFACLFPSSILSQENNGKESDDELVRSLSPEAQNILREARYYNQLNVLDESLVEYQKLLDEYPNNPLVLKEMGDVYARKKEFKKAKKLYAKAELLKPYDPKLRLAWIRSLEDNKQKEQAIEELQKMVLEHPNFIEARQELATYLSWEKKYDQAIEQYDQILYLKPDDVPTMLAKAQALNWSGKWKEAIPIYEHVLTIDPNNTSALKELALLYSWTQDWQKSQEAFKKLLGRTPSDREALEELGNAYFYDQQYDMARGIYTQVAENDPQIAQRVATRLTQIDFAQSPTIAYSFLYYIERDRSNTGGGERSTTESFYNSVEYSQPLTGILKLILTISSRHDDITKKTIFFYNWGLQMRLLRNLFYRVNLQWEPVDKNVNPRWGLRNALAWKPRDRWDVSVYHQYSTYWDQNSSNEVGVGVSRSFFQKRDVVLGYALIFDAIDDPNPYFVTIKKKKPGNMKLLTNAFNLQKYWPFFFPGSTLSTGIGYQVTTQGRNTILLNGGAGFPMPFIRGVQVSGGFSYTRDNRGVESMSSTGFASYAF